MTTKEFVESLRDGDRIRLKHHAWKYPIEGRIAVDGEHRFVGGFSFSDHSMRQLWELWDIEVLERAPWFYANVDREPVPGDVCRLNKESSLHTANGTTTWTLRDDGQWWPTRSNLRPTIGGIYDHQPILIVDGETGLPVMPKSVQAELTQLRAVADL